jgi:ribosome-binding protein aMBF1 (putative translation factor)
LHKLILLRNEKSWSQADFATMLGKPPSFVRRHELGERRLDDIEMMKISQCLGSDLASLTSANANIVPEQLA